jgi:hypothetical protein
MIRRSNMKKIVMILTLAASLATGLVMAPTATALATCDTIKADPPLLNPDINTHWIVNNCSAKVQVTAVLQEYNGSQYVTAECGTGGTCSHVRPSTLQESVCLPYYCAYTNNNRDENYNQHDNQCGHDYRNHVVVRNTNGDVLGTDNSSSSYCQP